MRSFEILLNGETRTISSSTVAELLSELSLAEKKVAVELNKQVVPRNAYTETQLSRGDVVELVQFVGGG